MCKHNNLNYTHDCEACISLGTYEVSKGDYEGKYDLYYCPADIFGPTIVVRYGNEGPEYYSFIGRKTSNPAMIEALKRVDEKGWKLECDEY